MTRRPRPRVRAQASPPKNPNRRLTISRLRTKSTKGLKELGPASAGPLFLLGAFCVSASSFARFRPVRPRPQGNNDSYQQENHDELGVFNHEGDHGIHTTVATSDFFSTARTENINTTGAQM
jgi:hypothetical protein